MRYKNYNANKALGDFRRMETLPAWYVEYARRDSNRTVEIVAVRDRRAHAEKKRERAERGHGAFYPYVCVYTKDELDAVREALKELSWMDES